MEGLNLEEVRCELTESVTAMDMMEKVLNLDQKTQTMVVLLLWLWWDERNKWREEGRRRLGSKVAYIVVAMTDKLKANSLPKQVPTQLLSDNRQKAAWTRPKPDVLKLNTDGAFLEPASEGGWGCVIRDHQGAVHKVGARREKFLQSAFHAKLLGCLGGL